MQLLRLVLITILLLIVIRLVRAAIAPRAAPGRPPRRDPQPPARPERLVEDPVCGLRLPESRALRDADHFFCSEECRRRFHSSA